MSLRDRNLPASFLFEGQFQHLLLLTCLAPGAVYLARPALDGGAWLGIPDTWWFYAVLAVVITHQVIVWFVFRIQLMYAAFTRLFGRFDMVVWGVIFLPFLVLRAVLTLGVAMADPGSLGSPLGLYTLIGLVLLLPAGYALWSVPRYFGLARALGGDHFRERYRSMPFVREGAFKYSSNAMYTFAFLGLWSIGLLAGSRAALAVALFQHAYIWVHMYCTEAPDMRVLYGGG